MDRRTTLRWIVGTVASVPSLQRTAWSLEWSTEPEPAASLTTAFHQTARGYGSDPDLLKAYAAGELWPLTFTPDQRQLATILSDLIIPAEETSPSASAVGTVDFIDEWISAPYKLQQQDRKTVLGGFAWLEHISQLRFSQAFVDLDEAQQHDICDDICHLPKVQPQFVTAAKFFSRYRTLTTGGFYTTQAGRQDLGYVGNMSSVHFAGPPLEALRKAGIVQTGITRDITEPSR